MLTNVFDTSKKRYSTALLAPLLGLVLTSCGGGGGGSGDASNNTEDAFNVPGSVRLASIQTVTTDGDTSALSYGYASDGRLSTSTFSFNGTQIALRIYSYTNEGKLLTRLTDYVDEDQADVLREYEYSGDRLAGFYSSFVGEQTDGVVQYQFINDRIVSYVENEINPPAENPTLSDGVLSRTGAYTYDESGFMIQWTVNDADGNISNRFEYDVASNGERLSHQTFDGESNLVSTSTWAYENAACIEFPGSIFQFICVQ